MNFTPGINKVKWQIILIPSIAFLTSGVFGIFQCATGQGFRFPFQLFFIIATFTFIIWEVNLLTYRRLDRQVPFFENPQKRFIRQVLYGFIATVVTFTVVYLLMAWILNSPVRFPVYFKFLFIASGISFLINSLYIYQYLKKSIYYREVIKTKELNDQLALLLNQQPKLSAPSPATVAIKSLLVEAGNKTLAIPFEEIAYFISGEGVVTLIKTDGQKLTTNYNSFSLISNRLPAHFFFQLNRQFITHLQSIRSVEDDVNRKLIVQIAPSHLPSTKELVTISRYRNPEFKQWFAQGLTQG